MKYTALSLIGALILVGAHASAQTATQSEAAVSAAARPQKLGDETRSKLVEIRKKVSDDPQYQQLLKAAEAAQTKANDYFLAKLKQAVQGDAKLAKHVDSLIQQHKQLRAAAAQPAVAP